jgi:hypothetical protein
MTLNLEGIAQLKFDLRANAEHYNQDTFGEETDCGTVCCMAGLCLRRQVGEETFKSLQDASVVHYERYRFGQTCVAAAAKQLGVALLHEWEYGAGGLPPIFANVVFWPSDLGDMYVQAHARGDQQAMAEVACMALDRMDDHGLIGPAVEEARIELARMLVVAAGRV